MEMQPTAAERVMNSNSVSIEYYIHVLIRGVVWYSLLTNVFGACRRITSIVIDISTAQQ